MTRRREDLSGVDPETPMPVTFERINAPAFTPKMVNMEEFQQMVRRVSELEEWLMRHAGPVYSSSQSNPHPRQLRFYREVHGPLRQSIDSTHTVTFTVDFDTIATQLYQAKLTFRLAAVRANLSTAASGGGVTSGASSATSSGSSSASSSGSDGTTSSAASHQHTLFTCTNSGGLIGTNASGTQLTSATAPGTSDAGGTGATGAEGTGATGGGSGGGGTAHAHSSSAASWSVDTTALTNSNNVDAHTHTGPSHTHTGPSHTHAHTATHTHTGPEHTHGTEGSIWSDGAASSWVFFPFAPAGGAGSTIKSSTDGSHTHTISHSHTIAHTHNIEHTHQQTAHTHSLTFTTIQEGSAPSTPGVTITINGTDRTTALGGPWNAGTTVDVTEYLRNTAGEPLRQDNTIVFTSTELLDIEIVCKSFLGASDAWSVGAVV